MRRVGRRSCLFYALISEVLSHRTFEWNLLGLCTSDSDPLLQGPSVSRFARLMITISLILKRVIVHDGLCIFHHPSPYTLLIYFPSQRPLQRALGHRVWVLQTPPSRLELHVHIWLRISYWVHCSVCEPGRACVWHSMSEAVCRCSLAATQGSFSGCLISMHHVNAQIRPLVALVTGKNKLTLVSKYIQGGKRISLYLPLVLIYNSVQRFGVGMIFFVF